MAATVKIALLFLGVIAVLAAPRETLSNLQDTIDGTWTISPIAEGVDITAYFCTHAVGENHTRTTAKVAFQGNGTLEHALFVGTPSFDEVTEDTTVSGNWYTPGFPVRVFPTYPWNGNVYCFDTHFVMTIPALATSPASLVVSCADVNGFTLTTTANKDDPNVPSDGDCFRLGDETLDAKLIIQDGKGQPDTNVCTDNGQFYWSRVQKGSGIKEYTNGITYEDGLVGSGQSFPENSDTTIFGTPRLLISLYDSSIAVVSGSTLQSGAIFIREGDSTFDACEAASAYAPAYSGMYDPIFPNMPGTFVCATANSVNAMYDYVGIYGGSGADGVYTSSFYESGGDERTCVWGSFETTYNGTFVHTTYTCADSGRIGVLVQARHCSGVPSHGICAKGAIIGPKSQVPLDGEWSWIGPVDTVRSERQICLSENHTSYQSSAVRDDQTMETYEEGWVFENATVLSGVIYRLRPTNVPFTGYSLSTLMENGDLVNFYYNIQQSPLQRSINGGESAGYWNYVSNYESDRNVQCAVYSYLKVIPNPTPSITIPSPSVITPTPPPPPTLSPSLAPVPAPFSASSPLIASFTLACAVAILSLL